MSEHHQIEQQAEPFTCANCAAIVPGEARHRVVECATGDEVCQSCGDEHYSRCADCDRMHQTDDMDDVGRGSTVRHVCSDCESTYAECDDCGERAPSGDMNEVRGGDAEVCDGCYSEYEECSHCDELRREVETTWVDGSRERLCDGCSSTLDTCGNCGNYTRGECCADDDDFDDDEGGAPEPSSSIQNQSRFYRTKAEDRAHSAGKTLLYLGYELEVECGNSSIGRSGAWSAMSCDYLRRHEDGSLSNGIEIVSMPMTYEFYKAHRDELHEKLTRLRRGGVRSYNTETCGIHVHLSRQAFSPYHLLKFMRLVYDNPAFTTKVSQRRGERLNQWASLTAENPTPKRLVRKAKMQPGYGNLESPGNGRYVAVNLENRSTVELRIFRGNLKPERFSKNIEYCVAAYHFSKQAAMSEITVGKFIAYVAANRREYPNLHTFLTEMDTSAYEQQGE